MRQRFKEIGNAKRNALVVLALALLGGWLGAWQAGVVNATPPAAAPATAPTASPSAPKAAAAAPSAPAAQPSAATGAADNETDGQSKPTPESPTVRIAFATSPSAVATVTWGRKRLGVIRPGHSLVITRPRDSGPLDVLVRSASFLPVQTRAHTFSDNRVVVKLTRPEDESTLLGYRQPLDAGMPDAGELLPLEEETAPTQGDAAVPAPVPQVLPTVPP